VTGVKVGSDTGSTIGAALLVAVWAAWAAIAARPSAPVIAWPRPTASAAVAWAQVRA
jgi:hypothetical protein